MPEGCTAGSSAGERAPRDQHEPPRTASAASIASDDAGEAQEDGLGHASVRRSRPDVDDGCRVADDDFDEAMRVETATSVDDSALALTPSVVSRCEEIERNVWCILRHEHHHGSRSEVLQSAVMLSELASDAANHTAIHEMGGIQALVELAHHEDAAAFDAKRHAVVALRLVAHRAQSQVAGRRAGDSAVLAEIDRAVGDAEEVLSHPNLQTM